MSEKSGSYEAGNLSNPLNLVKSIGAYGLLIFSLVIVHGLIFTRQTKISDLFHPAMAVCVLWTALIWMMMVEGSQASLVGLLPIKTDLFKDTHPITHSICKFIYTGDNFHRYLLGRQFMVVLLVFSINNAGGPLKDAELWGLPEMVTKIFLVSGLAMILFTTQIAQLPPQVVSSHAMLDFINNQCMLPWRLSFQGYYMPHTFAVTLFIGSHENQWNQTSHRSRDLLLFSSWPDASCRLLSWRIASRLP